MIMSDMDRWTDALSKCYLSEAIAPTSRGYLIENVECYNKIQALLNAPAMEHCHKFLYNLDVEDLQEDEVSKVNELYKLGQDRGFIAIDTFEPDDTEEIVAATDLTPAEKPAAPAPVAPQPEVTQPLASFTVMYSAMKDGQIKTGEAYSNSISTRAAKADIIAKLSQCGYDNISILAIEATDPDGISTQPNQAYLNSAQPSVGQVGVPLADAEDDDAEDDDIETTDDEDDDEPVEEAEKKDSKKDVEKADSEDDEQPDDADKEDADKEDELKKDKEPKKELSANEKQTLKDAYKTTFKEAMLACEFDGMKFDDLTLEQKIDLFTKLDEKWSGKPDPTEFMDDEDTDKLNNTVMKG